VALVPKRRFNKRTVNEALPGNRWIEDLQGEVDAAALTQYVHL